MTESRKLLLQNVQQQSWLVIGLLCALPVLVSVNRAIVLGDVFRAQGVQDFTMFFVAGRSAASPTLYEQDAIRQKAIAVSGEGLSNPGTYQSVRPPWVAGLWWPASHLPYRPALIGFKLLSVLAFGVLAMVAHPSRKIGALAVCWCMGTYWTLRLGQDTWLLALLFVGWARLRDRDWAAWCLGCAVALKPSLFVFAPLTVLAAGQYRLLIRVVAPSLLGVCLAFGLQGPHWPAAWLRTLRSAADVAAQQVTAMPTMSGALGLRMTEHSAVFLALFGSAAMVVVFAARRLPLPAASAISILLGMSMAAHSFNYDLALLPALCLTLAAARGSGWALLPLAPVVQVWLALDAPYGPLALMLSYGLCVGSVIFARRNLPRVQPARIRSECPESQPENDSHQGKRHHAAPG